METNLTFTRDWTTSRVPVWTPHLEQFRGKPAQALEIGCFEGRTTIHFVEQFLTHPDSRITCIDPFVWTEQYNRFLANILHSGVFAKVEIVRAYSSFLTSGLALRPQRKELDFAYIDGDHQAWTVLNDAVAVWSMLKVGGIMIFDDYSYRNPPGEAQCHVGIDAFLAAYAEKLTELHRGHQIIVQKNKQ